MVAMVVFYSAQVYNASVSGALLFILRDKSHYAIFYAGIIGSKRI